MVSIAKPLCYSVFCTALQYQTQYVCQVSTYDFYQTELFVFLSSCTSTTVKCILVQREVRIHYSLSLYYNSSFGVRFTCYILPTYTVTTQVFPTLTFPSDHGVTSTVLKINPTAAANSPPPAATLSEEIPQTADVARSRFRKTRRAAMH